MKKSVETLMPSFLTTGVLSKSHHEATKKSELSGLEKTQAFLWPLTRYDQVETQPISTNLLKKRFLRHGILDLSPKV